MSHNERLTKNNKTRALILELVFGLLLSCMLVYTSPSNVKNLVILPVFLVILLSGRNIMAAIITLPFIFISLFHPGILLDLYVLLGGKGSLYEKLVTIKIAFVHTTPVSYWLKVVVEFSLLCTCWYCYRKLVCKCEK